MGYNKNYYKKLIENPLPPIKEEERIYLNVPYMAKDFAKETHCRFDGEKKLWFTGVHNTFITELVNLYGINDATSEASKQMLSDKIESQKKKNTIVRLSDT